MRRLLLVIACLGLGLVGGCQTSAQHGRVLAGDERDPFVTVEAGNVQFRGGRFFARYAVDRATQTCWLIVGTSLAQMDCCDMRRVDALRDVTSWANEATCGSSGGAASAPSPVPAATPMTPASSEPTAVPEA